jgi:hypothetical protein
MTDSNGEKTGENGQRGRNAKGQFLPGSSGGPGRPSGRIAVEEWRRAFAQAVTSADIKAIVGRLVQAARNGEKWAITEVLDRTVGSLADAELDARLSAIEESLRTTGEP